MKNKNQQYMEAFRDVYNAIVVNWANLLNGVKLLVIANEGKIYLQTYLGRARIYLPAATDERVAIALGQDWIGNRGWMKEGESITIPHDTLLGLTHAVNGILIALYEADTIEVSIREDAFRWPNISVMKVNMAQCWYDHTADADGKYFAKRASALAEFAQQEIGLNHEVIIGPDFSVYVARDSHGETDTSRFIHENGRPDLTTKTDLYDYAFNLSKSIDAANTFLEGECVVSYKHAINSRAAFNPKLRNIRMFRNLPIFDVKFSLKGEFREMQYCIEGSSETGSLYNPNVDHEGYAHYFVLNNKEIPRLDRGFTKDQHIFHCDAYNAEIVAQHGDLAALNEAMSFEDFEDQIPHMPD